jgi:hypothetical protein
MDAEWSGWHLSRSRLFKENEKILFYIKGYSCDPHATIYFRSAWRLSRVDTRKLLEDQFPRVVPATWLPLSSYKYTRG